MPPPVQNKVKQCGGNACPRCGKCIDWSYDGDLDRDYTLYQRDNKCNGILHKDRWERGKYATCRYHSYHSHSFFYYDPYHYDYGYYSVCQCKT
jgi:hypothetical protein